MAMVAREAADRGSFGGASTSSGGRNRPAASCEGELEGGGGMLSRPRVWMGLNADRLAAGAFGTRADGAVGAGVAARRADGVRCDESSAASGGGGGVGARNGDELLLGEDSATSATAMSWPSIGISDSRSADIRVASSSAALVASESAPCLCVDSAERSGMGSFGTRGAPGPALSDGIPSAVFAAGSAIGATAGFAGSFTVGVTAGFAE